jgi:hypothetical protein
MAIQNEGARCFFDVAEEYPESGVASQKDNVRFNAVFLLNWVTPSVALLRNTERERPGDRVISPVFPVSSKISAQAPSKILLAFVQTVGKTIPESFRNPQKIRSKSFPKL